MVEEIVELPLRQPADPASRTRTVVAGAIGNVLEWYDFGLFGYFAAVIAAEFFPGHDRMAGLLDTFGVYATGFLMRPLGGTLFGLVGDRLGRKRALELSVLLMAISTTLLGLLPGYATIGLAAPFLLTLLRMFQGLSVGGEYIGSIAFLTEHAPPNRRALYGSWSGFTVVLGTLLGSGVAALTAHLLTPVQLHAWGWRVAFVSGLVIGAVGLWLRMGVSESPDFAALHQAGQLAANPIVDALRRDRRAIVTTIGLTGLSSVGFYLPFVWLPTWLSQIISHPLPQQQALASSTIALSALLVLMPPLAVLSDRVGRRPMYLAASAGFALLSYPLLVMMSAGTFAAAVAGGLAFAVCSSLFGCCMGATMVELFPTQTRYTGVAIGYNLGQAVLGGTAPLMGVALVKLTHNTMAPAFYLIACALVAGWCSWSLAPLHGKPLNVAPAVVASGGNSTDAP
ncbi:MAG TPA: MFS transporter [Planctomycetaceae bacterium]|nr:MFS transporter [Planctomycetaceae bacterium]